MKRFTFSVPQNILFGEGVLKELPGAAGKLGGKHGFIISGPTLNRLGVVGQCEEILTQAGIAVSTFCDTEGNPSVETVERAAEAFRASGADFIVALGGGSPMDVAKLSVLWQNTAAASQNMKVQTRFLGRSSR